MTLSPRNSAAIRTIFWDIGGVLLTNGWDKGQQQRVLTRLGVNLADYDARHDAANFFWERGLSDARTFFNKTVFHAEAPTYNFTFEDLWAAICAENHVLHKECFDILATLQSSGAYKLATLNNESRELNAYRLDAFHLRQYFDYFICSGYVHEMKPHPGIYQAAIDISGFPAETALFIDDKLENCEAATALGMQAIRFESPTQLSNELAQLGVNAVYA
jgi:HAD superfamily hydrolase (TIGR01509 family)